MFKIDNKKMTQLALKKIDFMQQSTIRYLVLSALAGIYVGFGIILVFSIGAPFTVQNPSFVKLIMGASFGVALTLVIFAGSELFTGNNMICLIGGMSKRGIWGKVFAIFFYSYIGNLIGSLFLAFLAVKSGIFSASPQNEFILKTVDLKMNLGFTELFIRGILCNWLVCLAVWTSSRTENDMAKIALIFWCLFAFVGSGFEHSVANMTLLGIGMFLPHTETISINGFIWNQSIVTLGNIIGGGMFVGLTYWFISPYQDAESVR